MPEVTARRWHLDHLDSLRGIAVLGVVLVHSVVTDYGLLPVRPLIQNIAFTGQRGVSLFFVASAFTLFLSHENRRDEHAPLRNFFVRRFFRIAPMLYVATAISYLFLRTYAGPKRDVLLSLVFLSGFFPNAINHGAVGSWSVADEAMFYMTLPVLFVVIKNLRAAMIWLGSAWAVCSLIRSVASARYPDLQGFFSFFSYSTEFPVFLMGIAAFYVWKEFLIDMACSDLQKKNLSLMVLAVAAVLYFVLLPFTYATLYQSSLVCMLLLLGLSIYPWSLFVNPITRFLGKVSYSIYLLHFVIILNLKKLLAVAVQHGYFHRPTVQLVGLFFTTLALTVPLAWLTWKWIEEPGIAYGRRLIAHLEKSRIT